MYIDIKFIVNENIIASMKIIHPLDIIHSREKEVKHICTIFSHVLQIHCTLHALLGGAYFDIWQWLTLTQHV